MGKNLSTHFDMYDHNLFFFLNTASFKSPPPNFIIIIFFQCVYKSRQKQLRAISRLVLVLNLNLNSEHVPPAPDRVGASTRPWVVPAFYVIDACPTEKGSVKFPHLKKNGVCAFVKRLKRAVENVKLR